MGIKWVSSNGWVVRSRTEAAFYEQHRELEEAYNDLKLAQSRFVQQKKMASVGQLAAGSGPMRSTTRRALLSAISGPFKNM
jgi:hypothetical protein